ncbi:MAG: flavodoxin domain-containing protein [Candidatus Doudnabacteria bacterium]|nr:flavodoxin domain-containing protein [Candidatus Doudnabacteria bacterium]
MSLPIIYASTSGNVELVCEYIQRSLGDAGIDTSLHRAEVTSIDLIKNADNMILATSTWEHGELNPFFAKLLSEMKQEDLGGKKAAFVGLGDRRYEPVLFCRGIEILQEAFTAQGGSQIGEILKIEGEPHTQLDSTVKPWLESIIQNLK